MSVLHKIKRRLAAVIFSATVVTGCAHLDQINKERLGTGVGTAIGAVVGTQFGEGAGRAVATVVGAAAGAWIGNQIGAYLDEQDRQRAAQAMQKTAVTGQTQSWRNSDTGVSGQAEVVNTTTTRKQVTIPVLKDRVQQVPPLDLIGEPYVATTTARVRGGPSTDYKPLGKLDVGEKVIVAGKVQKQNWYMISQGGAGSGFVYANLLKSAPPDVQPAQHKTKPVGPVESKTVAATQTCRTIKQTVTLADGAQREEEVTACQGPNGWEVS